MNSAIKKNIDEYNKYYEEIFRDLIEEVGLLNMSAAKSPEDCKTPNDYRLKLFMIRETIMAKLSSENPDVKFLKFILIKLNELYGNREYTDIRHDAIRYAEKDVNQLISDNGQLRNKNKKIKSLSENASLKSNLSKQQIAKLYELLARKFIEPSDDFEKLFSSPLIKPEMPLKWLKSNKLLAYFLETLYINELITAREYPSMIEKFSIFQNNKGRLINSNIINNAKSENNKLGNPLGFAQIDRIIEAVRKV